MFRTPRGYGNLNDLQNQMNSNLGYAGRLRELAQEFPQPPEDAMDAMKKGGRVKKFKQIYPPRKKQVKQAPSDKNIAIAKNVVQVYYDRPRRRASRRKPVPKPVEEKKVIVQPSQVRPQFVTNVMGGNPGQPIALNEFTKRLGLLEDQLNKPKILNRMVEEEKKVEIPTFTTTIPDAELKVIEQEVEDQKHEDVVEPGVIAEAEQPKLNQEVLVHGLPLFDTGVDFTYTRKNKQQIPTQYTSRIYITSRGNIKMNNTKGTLMNISQVLRDGESESVVQHLEDRGISGYPKPDEVVV